MTYIYPDIECVTLTKQAKLDKIARKVCSLRRIDKEDLIHGRRTTHLVKSRRLFAERAQKYFNQRQIAEYLDCNRSTISHYLNPYRA